MSEVDLDQLQKTREELKTANGELDAGVRSVARNVTAPLGSSEGKSGERGDDGTRGD